MAGEHSIVAALGCSVNGGPRARDLLSLAAWPLAVMAAAHVPAARDALPALGIARGPLGWTAIAIGIGVAAHRLSRGSAPARPMPQVDARTLFVAAALLYVA